MEDIQESYETRGKPKWWLWWGYLYSFVFIIEMDPWGHVLNIAFGMVTKKLFCGIWHHFLIEMKWCMSETHLTMLKWISNEHKKVNFCKSLLLIEEKKVISLWKVSELMWKRGAFSIWGKERNSFIETDHTFNVQVVP